MQAEDGWTEMAGIPRRDRETYLAHRARTAADPAVVQLAVEYEGELAGEVLSFLLDDGRRVIGYGVRKRFWGRGIATRALALLLEELTERPLYATVLASNHGSRRVLERNGFVQTRPLAGSEELVYVLE